MKTNGFTLAEVIVTVAIMGIIAALTIPSVLVGYNQTKYKIGLKKAVTTINEGVAMNIAKGKKSPFYTNSSKPLFEYLQSGINVLSPDETSKRTSKNSEFYTKSDIRFEFPKGTEGSSEFKNIKAANGDTITVKDSNCGTKGMKMGGSASVQGAYPCMILVDVNGDTLPNTLTDDSSNLLSDMFIILLTDELAVPYGQAAQKAYYEQD